MAWKTEATDEFTVWLESLSEGERAAFYIDLNLLKLVGPVLGRPYVDTVAGSRYSNMKELRTGTLRSFFIFDPSRTAILLIAATSALESSSTAG